MIECLFCEKEFEPKNKNQKFCSYECRYCYHRGDGTKWDGMSKRERAISMGIQLLPHEIEVDKRKRPWMYREPVKRTVIKLPSLEKPKPKKKPWTKLEKQKHEQPEYHGFIYLIESENNLYKIGRAKDVESRRAGLEREIPMKMQIIHTIESDSYIKAEMYLHQKYDEQRIRYEWFELEPEHIKEIESIPDFGLDAFL